MRLLALLSGKTRRARVYRDQSASHTHTFFPLENRVAVERHGWRAGKNGLWKNCLRPLSDKLPRDFTRDCVSRDVLKRGYVGFGNLSMFKIKLQVNKLIYIHLIQML